jgi:hypothetical protein
MLDLIESTEAESTTFCCLHFLWANAIENGGTSELFQSPLNSHFHPIGGADNEKI